MNKPFLAASLLLTLAVGCTTFKTAVYEDNLSLPLGEERPDTLLFSISLEYVSKGPSAEVADQMNSIILTQALDLEDGPGTIEEAAIRYRENLIDEYLTEADFTWEDHITGLFTDNYKEWKNYLLTYYNFRGGAHGLQTVSQIVFDARSGNALTEADFLTGDYEKPLAALLQQAVCESMEKESPELLELVQREAIAPNGNFSVTADGMEWLFQPYEIGPYALGIVTGMLSWEQLKPYLK